MSRNVACTVDLVPLAATETVVPDPGRLIFALRQIGYSLEQALSDLIDNAISAAASTVLIRFIWKGDEIVSIAVVDDGDGMRADELLNAMRFGSAERLDRNTLGKFGLGLKLASFSHARTLTVVTNHQGSHAGRRWSIEGIRRNWDCQTLTDDQAMGVCAGPWSPLDLKRSGTVVLWEQIDKLPVSSRGLRYTISLLHRRLELHFGLHFHRFIQNGAIRILIDQQEHGEREHQIRAEVPALDPFAYPHPPVPGFPRQFEFRIAGVGDLKAEAHIWPPNSEMPEYRLGNRAPARQGFYFYRNDRLIQAGGWNALLQNEVEPHGSLARVKINLPPFLDMSFSLNVQKSSVIVPPGFVEAVQKATDPEGMTFDRYRQAAVQTYRNQDLGAIVRRVPVPAEGLHPQVTEEVRQHQPTGDDETRPVVIRWQAIDKREFFRLDPENGDLLLNAYYRSRVLAGLKATPEDVPLVKALLFCLLEPDLRKTKPSAQRRRELARINRILVTAAELGMG